MQWRWLAGTRVGTVLLVGVGLALATSPSLARGDKPQTLALLPIVIHSAESPEYLQLGLADMLASRFEQVNALEIVRVDDPALATTRLATALETGRKLGVDFVLFGSFTRFGTGASLDMQAASTFGDENSEILREIFVHSGSIGEVIPDLEDLVGKVARFAVKGFTAPAKPAPGGEPAGGLAGRVRLLEQQVEALQQRFAGE